MGHLERRQQIPRAVAAKQYGAFRHDDLDRRPEVRRALPRREEAWRRQAHVARRAVLRRPVGLRQAARSWDHCYWQGLLSQVSVGARQTGEVARRYGCTGRGRHKVALSPWVLPVLE